MLTSGFSQRMGTGYKGKKSLTVHTHALNKIISIKHEPTSSESLEVENSNNVIIALQLADVSKARELGIPEGGRRTAKGASAPVPACCKNSVWFDDMFTTVALGTLLWWENPRIHFNCLCDYQVVLTVTSCTKFKSCTFDRTEVFAR